MPLTNEKLDSALAEVKRFRIFIPLVSIDAVIAQAREANALRAQLACPVGLTTDVCQYQTCMSCLTVKIDALRDKLAAAVAACAAEHPEVAELRKDTDRLYWWFAPHKDLGAGKDYLFLNVNRASTLAEWRIAIDAATGASRE